MDDLTSKRPVNTGSRISDKERARRQAQLDYARGSVRLEGFTASEEAEEIGRRYVNGDISLKQHSALIRQRHGL